MRNTKEKTRWSESWKKIRLAGTPKSPCSYFISNHGRVKSKHLISKSESILKGSVNKYGDRVINIKLQNGYEGFQVRRLVAIYFFGKPLKGRDIVININGDKKDCRLSNVKWVNQKELTEIQKKQGKYSDKKPDGSIRYKLTETSVALLKKRLAAGKTKHPILARQFKISLEHLRCIEKGQYWKDVKALK